MLNNRVIPCLLLLGQGLVKTRRFRAPAYLGDPINVVRIFNDKEVDELIILDIAARAQGRGPSFDYLREVVSECFMPVCYGGGIRNIDDMAKLFNLGIEKVSINTSAVTNPSLIREAAAAFGTQSVLVSLDVRRCLWSGYRVCSHNGRRRTALAPEAFAADVERLGAGELLLNSIDRDGTMRGYDIDLVKRVSSAVKIPVVACGGAGSLEDLGAVVRLGGASAAAAGSLFVFQGPHRAVLISYPSRVEIEKSMGVLQPSVPMI